MKGNEPCAWMRRTCPIAEMVKYLLGIFLLVLFGPYVAFQIFLCQSWELLDEKFIGIMAASKRISATWSHKFVFMVKDPNDGFVIPILFGLGVILPAFFFYELHSAIYYGFEIKRMIMYNIVRIGPAYTNFMWVYVLAHKEAHNQGSLFKKPWNNFLKYVFNHWVGLFHGVMPGNFTCSHVHNHHKYDNSAMDIVSTAFRARNSFKNWVTYTIDWFAYACNLTTALAFLEEGQTKLFWQTIMSTIWFVGVFSFCYHLHPMFTLATLGYAFVEANILLSMVNWVWHAFIDPDEPANDFINSTTIIDGLNFTLGEEYHVVHHQYAGVHWSKHRELYEKHIEGYKRVIPSVFHKKNIFEIFVYVVSDNVEKLAECFYKPYSHGKSNEYLGSLLRRRMECHGAEVALMRGKKGIQNVRIREGKDCDGASLGGS